MEDMEGFYTVNTPGDPAADTFTALRRAEYHAFLAHLPPPDVDVHEAVCALVTITGRSPLTVRSIIFSLYRLDELPKLKALHETLYHLDFNRLVAIDDVLDKLGVCPPADVLARIDAEITRYLTPRKARQTLPTVANLRRKLNALVAVADPSVDTGKEKRPAPPHYGATPLGGGRCLIHAEYDTADAVLIDAAVAAAASELNISTAEALKRLITGSATSPRIVLHVYKARDTAGAPAYVRGVGWVDPVTGDTLAAAAARTIDLDEHSATVSAAYATPEVIKRVVEARDGTCRFPHCTRPAENCQKDHCVAYADGGPTAAFNLVSLCQTHHNIKTDGRATYVIDPATDDIIWLFDDGRWQHSEATGPTAAAQRTWVRTIADTITYRRTHKRRTAQHTPTPPPDTPAHREYAEAPPF